ELVVALFACFRLGAVAVPLKPDHPRAELARVFRDCEPRLAIAPGALPALKPLTRSLPELPVWVVTNGAARRHRSAQATFACLENTAPQAERLSLPTADCLAVMLYTSGTTARPKGVMHIQGRMARAAAGRATMMALVPEDIVAAL